MVWLAATFLLASVSAVFAPVPASAQAQQQQQGFPPLIDTRGTPEDQKACERDAVKLCKPVLGDDFAVLRCFQENREKLAPACRAVLVKYGQ